MKFKENLLKEQKGITLIALVITIVVLLILSTVAIVSITRYNLIGYTIEAENTYKEAGINETTTLAEYKTELEKYGKKDKDDDDDNDNEWKLTGTYRNSFDSKEYTVYKRKNNTEVKIVGTDGSENIPTIKTEPNSTFYTPDGIEYSAYEISANSLSWWSTSGSSSIIYGESKDGSILYVKAYIYTTYEEAINAFGGGGIIPCGMCYKIS